jgi:hypothetical protein
LKLLTSAACIFADRWLALSNSQIIKLFLFGSSLLSEDENFQIFYHVQNFIKETKRFHTQEIWICLQFIFQYFLVCFSSI